MHTALKGSYAALKKALNVPRIWEHEVIVAKKGMMCQQSTHQKYAAFLLTLREEDGQAAYYY